MNSAAKKYLVFNAAGLALAAPTEHVKTVHEVLEVQSVDGTKPWFRGLAVSDGKLLPVTDIGAFCGRRSCSGRTLELPRRVALAGLQIDSVVGVYHASVEDVPFDSAEMTHSGDVNLTLTTRSIMHDDRVHRLLDIPTLVQSPVFLNIVDMQPS